MSNKNEINFINKQSPRLNEMLDPGEIYELYGELPDGSYLIRMNKVCQGSFIYFLEKFASLSNDSEEISQCVFLLALIGNQAPRLDKENRSFDQGILSEKASLSDGNTPSE